jgi:hypothetical protein
MPHLTQDEWLEVRAEWEASPRHSLNWLVVRGGGRWDISEEAIRVRRNKQGWQKPQDMARLARHARIQADSLSAARIAAQGHGAQPPDSNPPGVGIQADLGAENKKADARPATLAAVSDDAASEMRVRLIERHRAEWNAARKLVYEAMKLGEAATGFEKAKFAKISTEALRNIQDGERRAWSLDADMIDFDSLTDAQLQQVANGKMPR